MEQIEQLLSDETNKYFPKIDTIIVTFNPNVNSLFSNINEFIDAVNVTLLMDNSDDVVIKKRLKSIVEKYSNIIYIPLETNNGIGSAQNEAVRHLIDNKYDDDDLLLFLTKTVI